MASRVVGHILLRFSITSIILSGPLEFSLATILVAVDVYNSVYNGDLLATFHFSYVCQLSQLLTSSYNCKLQIGNSQADELLANVHAVIALRCHVAVFS